MSSHDNENISRAELKGEAQREGKESTSYEGEFSAGTKAFELQETEAKRRHKREMREKELGWLGRFLGGERSAPLTLAFLAIVAGIVCLILALILEACCPADSSVWDRAIGGSLTIISTALAYAFGRGSSRSG